MLSSNKNGVSGLGLVGEPVLFQYCLMQIIMQARLGLQKKNWEIAIGLQGNISLCFSSFIGEMEKNNTCKTIVTCYPSKCGICMIIMMIVAAIQLLFYLSLPVQHKIESVDPI